MLLNPIDSAPQDIPFTVHPALPGDPGVNRGAKVVRNGGSQRCQRVAGLLHAFLNGAFFLGPLERRYLADPRGGRLQLFPERLRLLRIACRHLGDLRGDVLAPGDHTLLPGRKRVEIQLHAFLKRSEFALDPRHLRLDPTLVLGPRVAHHVIDLGAKAGQLRF